MPDLDDLLSPLLDSPTPPVEGVHRRARRRARLRRTGTAAAIVVAGFVAVGLPVYQARTAGVPAAPVGMAGSDGPPTTLADPAAAPGPPAQDTGEPSPTTLPTRPPDRSIPTTTVTDKTVDARLAGDQAPWAEPPVPAADHPASLAAWSSQPKVRTQCPVLVFDDLGAGAGATPRVTDRGRYVDAAWLVYDLPGAPGEGEIQNPTFGAGKATFSIIAYPWPGGIDPRFKHITYADGSGLSYVVSGLGLLSSPDRPDSFHANVKIAGYDNCEYQLSTYLGEDHMVHLLSHLRLATP